MDALTWLIFLVVAALIVVAVVGILQFWNRELNLSDDDIALEKRMTRLNDGQANRRRDEDIVRLLSGDDNRIIGEDERR